MSSNLFPPASASALDDALAVTSMANALQGLPSECLAAGHAESVKRAEAYFAAGIAPDHIFRLDRAACRSEQIRRRVTASPSEAA